VAGPAAIGAELEIVLDRQGREHLARLRHLRQAARDARMRRQAGAWLPPAAPGAGRRATRACAGRRSIGSPSKPIAPAAAGRIPEMTRIKVVLPAPLLPTSATTSPRFTSSE